VCAPSCAAEFEGSCLEDFDFIDCAMRRPREQISKYENARAAGFWGDMCRALHEVCTARKIRAARERGMSDYGRWRSGEHHARVRATQSASVSRLAGFSFTGHARRSSASSHCQIGHSAGNVLAQEAESLSGLTVEAALRCGYVMSISSFDVCVCVWGHRWRLMKCVGCAHILLVALSEMPMCVCVCARARTRASVLLRQDGSAVRRRASRVVERERMHTARPSAARV
jgi:hypothetical protein